jgi:hypothetical protein
MSQDLPAEFPNMKGFSVRKLKYMRHWFQFWSTDASIGQQLVAQIPYFYISAVDGILKADRDNPSIGILICKSKNDTVVEYSLRDINKPIGVSEYTITHNLPEEFKSSLPSIEAIEAELGDKDELTLSALKRLRFC